jgi:hypothetical protein
MLLLLWVQFFSHKSYLNLIRKTSQRSQRKSKDLDCEGAEDGGSGDGDTSVEEAAQGSNRVQKG